MKCDAVIEKIKARVAAIDPNGPRKVLGVFQLNIEAADGVHEIVVDLKALKVSDGKAASPDVVINLKDEDFIAVGTKQIPVKDAVAQGKVTMTGDQNLFQALIGTLCVRLDLIAGSCNRTTMSLETVIEKVKARVAAVDPNGPRKVLGVFQFNIKTASGVEQYVIDLKQLKVEKGTTATPDVTVTLTVEDLVAVSARTLSVGDALTQGKLEIQGDAALAAKLAEVI
uniref:SCP2 domain-containing protein n=1 Tax=Anopheles epiroticus TaxID=199890 RepID=A0A182PNM3_9DIPT